MRKVNGEKNKNIYESVPHRQTTNAVECRGRTLNGSGGNIEEDDSDAGGDGGESGAASVQGPVRALADPSEQVPAGGAVPPVEVRQRTPLVREVRVRARHGADAPDAEDPRETGPDAGQGAGTRHSAHSQDCQRLEPLGNSLTTVFMETECCVD